MSALIEKAKLFAQIKHKGQMDDNGLDYFKEHIQVVADIVSLVTEDEQIIIAAYLHDTLEDTNTTVQELNIEFGDKVTSLVLELTHEGAKDERGYYFPRLHSQEGIMIKFADRLSNISRMQSWDEKRRKHYLKRSKFWKEALN